MDDQNNTSMHFSAIAALVKLGREKSFVTFNDILRFFPEAEKDLEQLDTTFATLHDMGIPCVDCTNPGEEQTEKD